MYRRGGIASYLLGDHVRRAVAPSQHLVRDAVAHESASFRVNVQLLLAAVADVRKMAQLGCRGADLDVGVQGVLVS